MQIKVNDTVEVITGDDRGERGKVLSVNRQTGKLVVEGVNRVFKHVRRSQRNPQGGRLSKELPVQASNVLFVCEKCSTATRLGVRYAGDGSKERFCKACGSNMGQVAPPRKAHERKEA